MTEKETPLSSRLKRVKINSQKVAEAISTVLNVEVEIIDNKLVRVAGTGKVRDDIGTTLLRGLVNKYVLKTGESIFVRKPGFHDICHNCSLSEGCFYKAYIVYPLLIEQEIIGTISLIAFNDEQRETLLKNNDSLLEFIARMSELISTKVVEIEINEEKKVMAKQLKALVDSVHEGVIAINSKGEITHFNKSAELMFGYSKKEVIGKNLKQKIYNIPLIKVLETGRSFTNKEVFINLGHNKKLHLISTAKPIYSKEKEIVGAVATFRDFSETHKFAYEILNKSRTIVFDDITGESKALKDVKEKAKKIAGSDSTVLILGESGTGKELFARAIHAASAHNHKPFISINCGAIPENLLESELFGYEEGAFTGAKKGGKPGKFELANGGTIFLDEIGNMSLYLQAKILRVLQEKQIERVGGTKIIPVDVRIIAATNVDLPDMVARGRFREDLYYRLSVIPLQIPPLRDRTGDIPKLLAHYLEYYNNLLGKNVKGFDKEALQTLARYPWPGNVRELVNAVEYAVNLEEGEWITLESLPPRFRDEANKRGILGVSSSGDAKIPRLDDLEREAIRLALEEYGWTEEGKEKAASALGISRATIYRKIQKYNITADKNHLL